MIMMVVVVGVVVLVNVWFSLLLLLLRCFGLRIDSSSGWLLLRLLELRLLCANLLVSLSPEVRRRRRRPPLLFGFRSAACAAAVAAKLRVSYRRAAPRHRRLRAWLRDSKASTSASALARPAATSGKSVGVRLFARSLRQRAKCGARGGEALALCSSFRCVALRCLALSCVVDSAAPLPLLALLLLLLRCSVFALRWL